MYVNIPSHPESGSVTKVFSSLQVMRASAALLVVAFHAADTLRLPKYWNAPTLKGNLDFGKSGVETFFALSGIVKPFMGCLEPR